MSAKTIKDLEINISEELSVASPEHQRRVLSLLFKNTPGAYTLEDTDDGKVKFKFTKAGRKYIKRYLKSFGRIKHDQLYGNPYVDSRGHRHGSGALMSA